MSCVCFVKQVYLKNQQFTKVKITFPWIKDLRVGGRVEHHCTHYKLKILYCMGLRRSASLSPLLSCTHPENNQRALYLLACEMVVEVPCVYFVNFLWSPWSIFRSQNTCVHPGDYTGHPKAVPVQS